MIMSITQRGEEYQQFILDIIKLISKMGGIAHVVDLPAEPVLIKGKVYDVAKGWLVWWSDRHVQLEISLYLPKNNKKRFTAGDFANHKYYNADDRKFETEDLEGLYKVVPLRLEGGDATALDSQMVMLASPNEPVPEPPRKPTTNHKMMGKGGTEGWM